MHIAAFEFAFAVCQPGAMMTGYNAANGQYCSDDRRLLLGILRKEMNFQGYIMTDWGGYGNQGPEAMADAGVSWIAPGSEDDTLTAPIERALKENRLSRARLQNNVCRLIRVLLKKA